ncbi:hypothetical protein [uncultured Draconibacterium sp.]|uniref:hypothetical protein n=1 Tax=uncultured Draconibacterium sp. TaxID=1573823 RepID=UPI002AA7DA3D|nr:hypothetical protein [uncultured Draconibacterium sp.]
MKTILTFLLLFPVLAFAQTENNNTRKWNTGVHFVHRSMNAYKYYDGYSYPRLSAEYSFTKCSSAEFMVERVGEIKLTDTTYPSYGRISLGYKLNILPWFTKNEWLVNNMKVYNSLRYALNFRNDYTDFQLLYAPGVECYIYKNFGLNTEFVFGQSMKTTFALGIKYRF